MEQDSLKAERSRKGGILAKLAAMLSAVLIFAVVLFIAMRMLRGG